MSDQQKLAFGTVLPMIKDVAGIFDKLIDGIMSVGVAKAELRNALQIAVMRLDMSDMEFAERDRKENERVK